MLALKDPLLYLELQREDDGLVCQAHPVPHISRDRNQVADRNASHIAWTIAAVN